MAAQARNRGVDIVVRTDMFIQRSPRKLAFELRVCRAMIKMQGRNWHPQI